MRIDMTKQRMKCGEGKRENDMTIDNNVMELNHRDRRAFRKVKCGV